MGKNDTPAPFALPDDLGALSAEDLTALGDSARAEFGSLYDGGPQADNLARAEELATAIEALTAEGTRRTEAAAETKAQFDQLMARVNPPSTGEAEPALEGEVLPAEGAAPAAPVAPAAPAPVAVTASARTAPRDLGGLRGGPALNPSMAHARGLAPTATSAAPRAALQIFASEGLPSGALVAGGQVPDLATLGDLLEHAARSLPVTASSWRPGQAYGGRVVARTRHTFDDVLDEKSSVSAVEAYQAKVRLAGTRPGAMESLVASGGWCAPSEIRYSFFNIACAGGKLDLPTFGVQRGGLRWPVSPTLADATSFTPDIATGVPTIATVPWLWTEISDVIAATGGAGLTVKPCIHVPCSTMDEARLECIGVCVTAGNLADNAWPESTANFLAMMDIAFQHSMNAQNIATIRAALTNVGTIACTGVGAASPVLDAVELAAVDYRKKFLMCWDDVVEVVFPEWIVPVLRADVARRNGVDMLGVTDAMILSWFDARHVRVQLVDDYQVRSTGLPGASSAITSWPTTVEFMLWAPGTFALGQGMALDLGVVRDSTLNETNDHTAAWYEQCQMIAKFGHEGRRYTVNICPSGVTGAANITACCA